eukprot:GHVU01006958.1.p1 GENE.GHVU01006958.1~~GHVU01006958.1.p1  ORF type:complete len:938 (-),score=195.67 GHVU01006958.1:848-3661(-)
MGYELQRRFDNRTDWGIVIPSYEWGRAAARMLQTDEGKIPEEMKLKGKPEEDISSNPQDETANARPDTRGLRATLDEGNEQASSSNQQLLRNIELAGRSRPADSRPVEYRRKEGEERWTKTGTAGSMKAAAASSTRAAASSTKAAAASSKKAAAATSSHPVGSSDITPIKIESDEEGEIVGEERNEAERGQKRTRGEEREEREETRQEKKEREEQAERKRRTRREEEEQREREERRRDEYRGRGVERREYREEDQSPQKRRRYNEGERETEHERKNLRRERVSEEDYQRSTRRREEASRRERIQRRETSEAEVCSPRGRGNQYTSRANRLTLDRERRPEIILRELRNEKDTRETREREMENVFRRSHHQPDCRSRSRHSYGQRRNNDLPYDRDERPSVASIGFWRRTAAELRLIPQIEIRASEDEISKEEEKERREGPQSMDPENDPDLIAINWTNFPNSQSLVNSHVFTSPMTGKKRTEIQNHLGATVSQELTRRFHFGLSLEDQRSIISEIAAIYIWQLMGCFVINSDDEYHARMTMDRILDFIHDMTRWWSFEDVLNLLYHRSEWHERRPRADPEPINWKRPWNLFALRCLGKDLPNQNVATYEEVLREYADYLHRRQQRLASGWHDPPGFEKVTCINLPPFDEQPTEQGLEHLESHRFDEPTSNKEEGTMAERGQPNRRERGPLIKGGPTGGRDWADQKYPRMSDSERRALEKEWRYNRRKTLEKHRPRTRKELKDAAWKEGANLMNLTPKEKEKEPEETTKETTATQVPEIKPSIPVLKVTRDLSPTSKKRQAESDSANHWAKVARERKAEEMTKAASQAVQTSNEGIEGAQKETTTGTSNERNEEAPTEAITATSIERKEEAPQRTKVATSTKERERGILVGVQIPKGEAEDNKGKRETWAEKEAREKKEHQEWAIKKKKRNRKSLAKARS